MAHKAFHKSKYYEYLHMRSAKFRNSLEMDIFEAPMRDFGKGYFRNLR